MQHVLLPILTYFSARHEITFNSKFVLFAWKFTNLILSKYDALNFQKLQARNSSLPFTILSLQKTYKTQLV